MLIELTRDAKVNLTAGTVVNVATPVASFLMSVGSAKAATAAPAPVKRTTRGKK